VEPLTIERGGGPEGKKSAISEDTRSAVKRPTVLPELVMKT
jgi:hypothetical protein